MILYNNIRFIHVHIQASISLIGKKFTSENLKVHDRVPVNPNTGKLIHSVCLRNDSAMSILVDAFGENALQYSKKKKARQCECVIYPDNYKDTDWVLFVEMKYAENEIAAFRKGNDYPNNMIEQIKQTVQFFKDKCILPQEKRSIRYRFISQFTICIQ